jgi:hypothetical protein
MLKTNATIKCLNLSHNKVRTSGGEAIADMLRANTSLTEYVRVWCVRVVCACACGVCVCVCVCVCVRTRSLSIGTSLCILT